MPLVSVVFEEANFDRREVQKLEVVCKEIVPAAMCTPQGRLSPGSIEFFARPTSLMDDTHDVFIDIEATYYADRDPSQGRSEDILNALRVFFPNASIAVWAKLVNAGYAATTSDPDEDVDMSMAAAIERAHVVLNNSGL